MHLCWQLNVMRTISDQGMSFALSLSPSHLQLTLQWHGGVDALAQDRHTLLHRTHLHVDQAAAGVTLGRARFPVFRRRHPAFLHTLELDCRANTNTRKVIVTAPIPATVSHSQNCIHRRWLKWWICFLPVSWFSHSTERKGNMTYVSSDIFSTIFLYFSITYV